ncbi:MAG TPA: hypothetical protein GX509_04525 [Firmicutes bacterium]|nr:hypothetical protein [Bacillota bacterium]HHY97987.1 hypothetical protein [Bacillota bacterium]
MKDEVALLVSIKGVARIGFKTKDLVKRLGPGDIAVIDHKDVDEVACEALIRSGIKAIINADECISGEFPNTGPARLLESGIHVVDKVGRDVMTRLSDGDRIEIRGGVILHRGKTIGVGEVLGKEIYKRKLEESQQNLAGSLEKFIQNTLDYANHEKALILGDLKIPDIKTQIAGKPVVVVVRGHDYREDLVAIAPYIREEHPVLMGVDGGADALVELGYRPDIIIGDMDSVSDRVLGYGAEVIVHAYPGGRAPGLDRVRKLGIDPVIFAAPGTSEDIALLLAYEKGADLIVAVGTHSNMIDFLEKGRKGMASTFLVRLKVGPKLVDAKGVNKLYKGRVRISYVAGIVLGALLPFTIVLVMSGGPKQLFRLLFMWVKVMLNIY